MSYSDQPRTVAFDFLGESIEVRYLHTPAERVVINGWNLIDDDGKPLPMSPDTLLSLPIAMLARMYAALRDDLDAALGVA